MKFNSGDRVDQWRLIRPLGRGGSSEVWVARDEEQNEVVLKLQNTSRHAARFPDEVKLHGKFGKHPGILPVLTSSFDSGPGQSRTRPAWIAMEIATPLTDYLGPTPEITAVVDAIRSYADTLSDLAAQDVHHRDIKPSNLYWLERFVIWRLRNRRFSREIGPDDSRREDGSRQLSGTRDD
jgi:serine/threonine protein kinase